MSRPVLYHWLQESMVVNAGDYFTAALFQELGVKFDLLCDAPDAPEVILGAGTMLNPYFLTALRGKRKIVWGSGLARVIPGDGVAGEPAGEFSIRAVRGPLTRDALELPEEGTVTCDPGLLAGKLVTKRKRRRARVLYAPHLSRRMQVTRSEMVGIGADEFLDMTCQRNGLLALLEDVDSADIVLGGSLHSLVFAAALGKPFAACAPAGVALSAPFKFRDFGASIGVDIQQVRNVQEGRLWWEQEGHKLVLPDLNKLIDACPVYLPF